MYNIKKTFNDFSRALTPLYDHKESASISRYYFEEALGIDFSKIISGTIDTWTQALNEQMLKDLEQLRAGVPIQHLLGWVYFEKHKFNINKHTLIPRPETEGLVSMIIEIEKNIHPQRALDIGTGSGCLIISLARALKLKKAIGLDVSEAALKVAQSNITIEESNICFQLLNLLEDGLGSLSHNKFDFIVSNPPYIPHAEKPHLHKNVRDYEPPLALFVPDEQPLVFFEKILVEGRHILKSKGRVYFEMHHDQGKGIVALCQKYGYTSKVYHDLFEKERFVFAEML